MILVGTSVWVDHLRGGDPLLVAGLAAAQVLVHPFVTGGIALGALRNRAAVLNALGGLPQADRVADVLGLIDRHGLARLGIGYVDAHLLTSTLFRSGTTLWTRDRRLHAAAARLGIVPP